MVRVDSVLVCCLLHAAAPADAQNSDVFREEAPPPVAAPAPSAVPRPRPVPQPQPEVAAPAPMPAPVQPPAPSLPPASQLWARIRQVAQSQGIAVPLASNPAFDMAGTPSQYRPLLGAWGPGTWQGNSAGDAAILVIEGIDADGAVRAVIAKSAGGTIPGSWSMSSGTIAGNRFTLKATYQMSQGSLRGPTELSQDWQFEARSDGTLAGSRDNGASTIVLQRLQ